MAVSFPIFLSVASVLCTSNIFLGSTSGHLRKGSIKRRGHVTITTCFNRSHAQIIVYVSGVQFFTDMDADMDDRYMDAQT